MNRTSSHEGLGLAYERSGCGTPLLLIGGLGCDRHFVKPCQIDAFSQHHDVITYDNRGIGDSDKPRGPYTTEMMADDAAVLLGALEISSAHVLGVSMGAMIALQLAARHPALVRSLIVACGTARADEWMKRKQVLNQKLALSALDENSFREVKAWMDVLWMFGPASHRHPGVIEEAVQSIQQSQQPRDAYVWQSQALHDHDVASRLGAIRCPTLVLAGKEDILTPIRYSEEIARSIPGAELRVFDGGGHLFMLEKPEEFNSCVLEFLADVERTQGAQKGQDEIVEIPAVQEGALDGRLRCVAGSRGDVLICRGLTGDFSMSGSLDELADALAGCGWSSLRFDYRGRGRSRGSAKTPTVNTMCEDVQSVYDYATERFGRPPSAVIARGFAARLVLEVLRGRPEAPFLLWAPIVWLRTSLEMRGRLHELRRRGRLIVDGSEIPSGFVDALEDPTDLDLRAWIVPQRRHVIIQPEGDAVSPPGLARELQQLITSSGGCAELVLVPGAHPHPKMSVRPQICAIVSRLQSACQSSGRG